jgi:hypothetical protein
MRAKPGADGLVGRISTINYGRVLMRSSDKLAKTATLTIVPLADKLSQWKVSKAIRVTPNVTTHLFAGLLNSTRSITPVNRRRENCIDRCNCEFLLLARKVIGSCRTIFHH